MGVTKKTFPSRKQTQMAKSSVPFKREKRENLRKHVWRIRSLNLTMHEKVRRYLVIFFSWSKFCNLRAKFSINF